MIKVPVFIAFLLGGLLFGEEVDQVTVQLKFVEIDDSDYDVVKAELEAGKLRKEFEGLNMSAVTPGFWEKIESFPGSDVLSAPKVTSLVGRACAVAVGSDLVYAEEFLENGDPAGLMQKKFVGIRAELTSSPSKRGIALELSVEFSKRAGETPVPHGTVPIFSTKTITTRVILPENVPAMIGGFSADGRKTLIICQAKKTLK
jgi:hypothetical protein